MDVHPAFQKTQEHAPKEDEICDPVSLMMKPNNQATSSLPASF